MPDFRNKGIEIADKMLDPAISGWLKSVQGGKGLDSAMGEVALDFAFGAVWARPNLSMDKRSAVVLGILIATNQGDELKIHLGIALKNGLSRQEIDEIILQAVPYAGFPAVARAAGIWREVLAAVPV